MVDLTKKVVCINGQYTNSRRGAVLAALEEIMQIIDSNLILAENSEEFCGYQIMVDFFGCQHSHKELAKQLSEGRGMCSVQLGDSVGLMAFTGDPNAFFRVFKREDIAIND